MNNFAKAKPVEKKKKKSLHNKKDNQSSVECRASESIKQILKDEIPQTKKSVDRLK